MITAGEQNNATLPTLDSADSGSESTLGRMGVRAALVLLLLLTSCLIALAAGFQSIRSGELPTVIEPVGSLSLLAVGYYFGQKSKA